jgi:hypothetical protein
MILVERHESYHDEQQKKDDDDDRDDTGEEIRDKTEKDDNEDENEGCFETRSFGSTGTPVWKLNRIRIVGHKRVAFFWAMLSFLLPMFLSGSPTSNLNNVKYNVSHIKYQCR